MSIFESSREMKPNEKACFELGYKKGCYETKLKQQMYIETVEEIRKETAREILSKFYVAPNEYHFRVIEELAKEYGIDIEGLEETV